MKKEGRAALSVGGGVLRWRLKICAVFMHAVTLQYCSPGWCCNCRQCGGCICSWGEAEDIESILRNPEQVFGLYILCTSWYVHYIYMYIYIYIDIVLYIYIHMHTYILLKGTLYVSYCIIP